MTSSPSTRMLRDAAAVTLLTALCVLLSTETAVAQNDGAVETSESGVASEDTAQPVHPRLKEVTLPGAGAGDPAEEPRDDDARPGLGGTLGQLLGGGGSSASTDDRTGAETDNEAPTAADAETGQDAGPEVEAGKKGIFNRFVKLFRGGGEDGDSEEDATNAEIQKKVNALERSAKRNFERSRISEAKKNLNDLITLRPYDANYHFALGLCFRKEGRHKDATKKYKDVIDLGGPKPLVRLLMAEAATRTGEKKDVFGHLQEAAVGGRNIFHDVTALDALQTYRTDTEFIKLALSLERIELESKPTEDPFSNVFKEVGPEDVAKGGDEDPEPRGDLTPDEQKKLYNDARKAYERVVWYIKLEDEKLAMENYRQLDEYFDKLDKVTVPMIKNDFQRLHSRMETLEAEIEGIRLKYYYNEALAQLKLMKQAFFDTEYSRVEQLFQQVRRLAQDMETTNARYKPVADQVLRAGQVWIDRTRVRQEFEANKPDIQGVIIAPETNQVMINGRVMSQGERFGEFKIYKVENNKVTFRFKGEEIPLIFRRY